MVNAEKLKNLKIERWRDGEKNLLKSVVCYISPAVNKPMRMKNEI